jgi:hypothetical protein
MSDGRTAYFEQHGDGRWHVIVGHSTIAVADSKEQARDFVRQEEQRSKKTT